MNILDDLENIGACQSPYAVKEAILQYSKERGFSSFILGLKSSKSTDYSSAFIVSNYATSWREKYEENNFHSVDPTVGHALGSLRPLTWSRSTFRSVAECEFYEEASHFGIKTGITFPIHGVSGEFGLISFASDQDLAPRDLLVAAEPLAWLRDIVFDITLRLMSESAQTLKKSPLTPRESECLKWIVMGKTSWEISKILFCTEANVNYHIYNIAKKLGVRGRQQAVVKSIREGWI
ncbi:LuxR family transcriptional regulator (plasmid) [Burkholderia sp. FERM BP-3421]|uniref:helix-turn-helix transcriptional regulator n=1 Tax=Burkholderia sp. FERM BP-3421 TaxID=1494466 RepID=UPI00235DF78A|nr:LuxR family transcriptional regulator [Burkholderia sp. FERM BP-3421]WDD90208.1 LuxR family transcriptional regulator [Burkholderia sp. FERM BP-3421]